MKMKGVYRKGFTLLEILVVVAIFALFVAVVLTNVTKTKARSRDTKRESDIKQLQQGLNVYATARGSYPDCQTKVVIDGRNDCLSAALISGGAMVSTPVDPLGGAGGICNADSAHVYCYISNGSSYTLEYSLETDSISGKQPGWRSVTP